MITKCGWCGNSFDMATGAYNRAMGRGARVFCGLICSGMARRKYYSSEERKALKAEYDRQYRVLNREKLKASKATWYRKTKDPEKERIYRKANMGRHIEYCRRPEYREYKKKYDRRYRAIKEYGEFAEAFLALQEIDQEIASRVTRFESYALRERRSAQWRKRQL